MNTPTTSGAVYNSDDAKVMQEQAAVLDSLLTDDFSGAERVERSVDQETGAVHESFLLPPDEHHPGGKYVVVFGRFGGIGERGFYASMVLTFNVNQAGGSLLHVDPASEVITRGDCVGHYYVGLNRSRQRTVFHGFLPLGADPRGLDGLGARLGIADPAEESEKQS